MQLSPISTNRLRHAFTLVEVLAAIAVLAFLVLILVSLVGQSTRLLTRGRAQTETLQTLRAVSHMMSRDLQGAVLPVSPTNQLSLQFAQNPPGVSSAYRNPDSVFWQSSIATETSHSEIAIVGYFVMWDRSNASNPKGKLCRYYVPPTDLQSYQIYTQPSAWISDTLIGANAPGLQAANYKGMLAENIIGLWISFEASDASGNPLTLPTPFDSRVAQRLPNAAVVSIAFVSPTAAKRITDTTPITALYASGPNNFISNLPQAIREDARLYTTRIMFKRSD